MEEFGGAVSGYLSIPRVLASWLVNEKITLQFMLGGTLVVLGVWIGALWVPRKKELQ